MDRKLFVGNLPFSMDSDRLAGIFCDVGEVTSAKVVIDKMSGRSRGFGFVEMATAAEAVAAVHRLNGSEIHGRPLRVSSLHQTPPMATIGA